MTFKAITYTAALLGVLGAAALTPATAADVYERGSLKDAPPPAYTEPFGSWGGFFIGGHAGAIWGEETLKYGGIKDTIESDAEFTGGGHAGYNWQVGNTVFGFEGDFDYVDLSGVNWLATARAKLGYATGPTLFYVTGGAAFLDLDYGFGTSGFDDTTVGWVVGGGLDYQFKPGWSMGVEALYYNFDDNKGRYFDEPAKLEDEFLTVRARLTYHVGGADLAPVEPLK